MEQNQIGKHTVLGYIRCDFRHSMRQPPTGSMQCRTEINFEQFGLEPDELVSSALVYLCITICVSINDRIYLAVFWVHERARTHTHTLSALIHKRRHVERFRVRQEPVCSIAIVELAGMRKCDTMRVSYSYTHTLALTNTRTQALSIARRAFFALLLCSKFVSRSAKYSECTFDPVVSV